MTLLLLMLSLSVFTACLTCYLVLRFLPPAISRFYEETRHDPSGS